MEKCDPGEANTEEKGAHRGQWSREGETLRGRKPFFMPYLPGAQHPYLHQPPLGILPRSSASRFGAVDLLRSLFLAILRIMCACFLYSAHREGSLLAKEQNMNPQEEFLVDS